MVSWAASGLGPATSVVAGKEEGRLRAASERRALVERSDRRMAHGEAHRQFLRFTYFIVSNQVGQMIM